MADKYYDMSKMKKVVADYKLIFGERSNGKTYSVLLEAYENWLKTGKVLAIIRRWDTDYVGPQGAQSCYNSLMCNGEQVNMIDKLSNGNYQGVLYMNGKYWLTRTNADGVLEKTDEYIAIAFSLSRAEHYKMGNFPDVGTILFDEFVATGNKYLNNEYTYFVSVISTIVRQRDDITIYMCANTMDIRGCLYFKELGLKRVRKQAQGTIDIYNFGTDDEYDKLVIACEYTEATPEGKKKSNKYFKFNDKKNAMITQGAMELPMMPHLPIKYAPKDIIKEFYIEFNDEMIVGKIIRHEHTILLFFHEKTTELKYPDKDTIYSTKFDIRKNWHRNLFKENDKMSTIIRRLLATDKVYFSTNDVGAIFLSYKQWCISDKLGN